MASNSIIYRGLRCLVEQDKFDETEEQDGHVVFHWLWTGTNTGAGGTGKFVRMIGYERWKLDQDGLIEESKGHYDEEEYHRQLEGE